MPKDFIIKKTTLTAVTFFSILQAACSVAGYGADYGAGYRDQNFLVVIDAGHGGQDVGAVTNTRPQHAITEKDLTLALALKIEKELKSKGLATYLTRTTDEVVPLDSRTALANAAAQKYKESVFISIHVNSSSEKKVSGFETYVFNATTNEAALKLAEIENASFRVGLKGTLALILSDLTASANYKDSLALGCRVQANVIDGMRALDFTIKDRGIKPGLFYVLLNTQMPGILIEAGFSTNPQELEYLVSHTYQKRLAEKIAGGIWRWHAMRNYKKHDDKSRGTRLSGIHKKAVNSLDTCKNFIHSTD